VSNSRSSSGGARGTKARAARASEGSSSSGRSPKKPRPDAGAAASGSLAPPRSGRTRTRSRSGTSAGAESGPSTTAVSTAGASERRAALVEERDFLLASLRDLEAEHAVGDVDDVDYEALKDDYTVRAANVIKTLDGLTARPTSAPAPRSWTRRLVAMALVVVFAVGAGVLVARSSGDRGAGDSITGGIRSDTRDELLEARQDGAQQKYLDAIKVYSQVLQQDPANTEALAYKGWMLRLVSLQATGTQQAQLQAEAKASLEQALRTSPKDPTSLVFMAALLGDLGQPQAALADLDRVPPGQLPSFMSSTIGQLRAQLEAQVHPASTPTTAGP
jgi:hypothetical protein